MALLPGVEKPRHEMCDVNEHLMRSKAKLRRHAWNTKSMGHPCIWDGTDNDEAHVQRWTKTNTHICVRSYRQGISHLEVTISAACITNKTFRSDHIRSAACITNKICKYTHIQKWKYWEGIHTTINEADHKQKQYQKWPKQYNKTNTAYWYSNKNCYLVQTEPIKQKLLVFHKHY